MKKARLLLAAIAITSIVGGSLAFKAAHRSAVTVFVTYTYGQRAYQTFEDAYVTAATAVPLKYYTFSYGATATFPSRVLPNGE